MATAMADFSDVDYFEEASSSIELVQQLASRQVPLNLFQCRYLSSKLAETGSFLVAKSETLRALVDRDDIRRKALLMLHFTVKRAEKLVRNCSCETESWLEAAVTLAQIKEDIVDILLDLQWWKSMVDIAIASVTWMSSGKQIELELLTWAEEDFQTLLKQLTQVPSNDLDEAVVKDKEDLMKRLRQVQASSDGDPQTWRQYLLAALVRSRLENKTFETMGDTDLNVYDDISLIGMGGFGAVLNVRWLGRRCALKVLKYKCRKEATSLSAFQHPHIVQFYRYWEAPFGATPLETPHSTPRGGSTSFTTPSRSDTSMTSLKELQSHILMELLPGDLAEHMKARIKANGLNVKVGSKRRQDPSQELPMNADATIDAMLQIAKAMWHLNSKDVAHRDLKPNNVLVRPVSKDEVPELSARGYLRVKLGDFGLAKTKAYSSVTTAQTAMVGTRIYGAPEVFSKEVFSERKFPRRADVWSFGIMFNEILSGRPPYDPLEGQRVADLQGKLRRGWRPALPENCPDYLKFCITSCWQLRPEDRPNFADLWKMVRFAQVRSLGLIRENHDLFIFRTRESQVKRLHSYQRPAALVPLAGRNGSSQSNPIWLLISRIAYLLGNRLSSRSEPAYGASQSHGAHAGSSSRSKDKPLGYLVNRVWPMQSTSETTLDVIFFEGNVGSREYLSCRDTWVQRGKPDVCWPRDWLPKEFRSDIRVFLLEYSISEAGVEGVVDEVERLLVYSDRWNRGHTWEHPVVLVGHSLGCVVIEQLVVALHKRAEAMGSLNDEVQTKRAKDFLAGLAGCFFYAAPWKGLVPSEELLKHVFGGLSYSRALFADLRLDSPKLNKVSKEFVEARSEHVKLMALVEGFHTKGRTVVPSASMEGFPGPVVHLPDSNHDDACKPLNKEHPAYAKLVEFIRDVSNSRRDSDEPLFSSASQTSSTEGSHSRSTVNESLSFQKVVGLPIRDVSDSRRDFDEPIFISVSQRSLSEGSHSRSTVKQALSFQKVVELLLNLKQVFSGPGHFHANQCRILKEQLSLAKEILIEGRASRGDSSGDLPWPKLALTELHRLLKLGKTSIKDCQYKKHCLKAYLRQGERAQAFAEILKAIVWCKSVVKFYHENKGRVSFTTILDEFPQVRLGDEEQYLLQKAADDDQMELQALLDNWIVKHPCSAKECGRPLSEDQADNSGICLADQISARVSNREGDVGDDHSTVLWKTSQDALEDGTVIGTGACGTVTETTWLGDKFAKKAFDRVPTDFENEANALAKLNHPHIVKVSAYGVSPQTCFFLMDIMPGNLRKYMNKRMEQLRIDQPFSLSAAIDLMLQISEAMSYMNSKGMVHRGLKPLNILVKPVDDAELRKAGFVTSKLADFGLAKTKHFITSHSHSTPNNLGTSLWRAPEMYRMAIPLTDKAYPWQADVYSFGIVCSEILTGKMPFQGVEFQMGELYGLLTDPHNPLRPKLPENCPERLAFLIRECWQTNPEYRPTFEEVSRRLRNIKALFMVTTLDIS